MWYQSVAETKRVLATTTHIQTEMHLIYQMRDYASRHAIFLLPMTQSTDNPFELDEHYIQFKEYATQFLTVREKLLGPETSDIVIRSWEKSRPLN